MVKTINVRMKKGGINQNIDFKQDFKPSYLDNLYVNDDKLL